MVFYATGGVGIAFGMYWLIVYRDPMHSRKTRQAELDLIKAGGRYGSQDQTAVSAVVERADIIYLLKSKTVWGLFVAQFAYNSTLIFFMTWFIVYLEKALTSRCRKQD